MFDEVVKALAGVASSGPTDSGVSARMLSSLLAWLNDHESDVFVVCTSNDISKLPPEFSRCEGFDATFFLDLPSPPQRQSIWRLYLDRFGLDPD
jgi:SpoVK/Ycf46/Vps4 family AAA+-type ATPase